jgi:hypothetical protein
VAAEDALAELLDTVLADVRDAAGPRPRVEYESRSDTTGQIKAMLYDCDGTGSGVSVMPGRPRAEQLAGVADQVQEWCIEARWSRGLSTNWPPCPHHPTGHPLAARVSGNRAVWVCAVDALEVADVGRLGSGEGAHCDSCT